MSFIDAASGRTSEVVQASEKPIIRLPFDLFDHETIEDLINDFPAMTIIRKEKALTDEQWNQIKLDARGRQNRAWQRGRTTRYLDKREKLITALEENQKTPAPKTRRVGLEGCCGKGCNGCLMFWHEPKYAKARAPIG